MTDARQNPTPTLDVSVTQDRIARLGHAMFWTALAQGFINEVQEHGPDGLAQKVTEQAANRFDASLASAKERNSWMENLSESDTQVMERAYSTLADQLLESFRNSDSSPPPETL